MAILIRGVTVCSLCGCVISECDEAVVFPAFAQSTADPYFEFSDGSFHTNCLLKANRGSEAIGRVEQRLARTGPGRRKCVVCQLEVLSPDDYLLIDFLGDLGADPLAEFSYTHFHRSCIWHWPHQAEFVALARSAIATAHWNADYLRKLVDEISVAVNDGRS